MEAKLGVERVAHWPEAIRYAGVLLADRNRDPLATNVSSDGHSVTTFGALRFLDRFLVSLTLARLLDFPYPAVAADPSRCGPLLVHGEALETGPSC